MALVVNEIFYSLQGESSFSGLPCIFIRLTGCNLRCSYCDTTYAYHEGEETSIPQIMTQIKSYPSKLVEITGGEPLLQEECPALMKELLRLGYDVLIETNGSQNIHLVPPKAICIMDLKCPGKHISSAGGSNTAAGIRGMSCDCSRSEMPDLVITRFMKG